MGDVRDRALDAQKTDFLVSARMADRAREFRVPRRACVLPPWDFELDRGLSDEEQRPEVWKDLLTRWARGGYQPKKGTYTTTTHLFLVCARTDRLVPCGHKGQGYEIRCNRKWFRGAVGLTQLTLQVAVDAVGGGFITDLTGNALGDLAERAINAGAGKNASGLEDSLLDGIDIDVQHQTQNLDRDAYASLCERVEGMESAERLKAKKKARQARKNKIRVLEKSEFVFFNEVMEFVQELAGDDSVKWVLK